MGVDSSRYVALILVLIATRTAYAAENAQPKPVSPEGVEVTATGYDPRQSQTATKNSITREELEKYGDQTLSDALKRAPGVTVDSEIRMRGLGAGYTQILINGEPAAPGFTVDSIPPEMIERIEIFKAPVAEHSAQAVAGTINVILRKGARFNERRIKLTTDYGYASWSPGATLQMAGSNERFSYQLLANGGHATNERTTLTEDTDRDASGAEVAHRFTEQPSESRRTGFNIAPQVSWKLDRGILDWQVFAQGVHSPNSSESHETTLLGEPTQYPDSRSVNNDLRGNYARMELGWASAVRTNDKLEVRVSADRQSRTTDFHFYGFDPGDVYQLDRNVLSSGSGNGFRTRGKYATTVGRHHELAVGWEGAYARRSDSRLQLDRSAAGDLLYALDQQYAARMKLLAFFAQDEWAATDRLKAYMGLRWEELQTEVTGEAFDRISNRSGVLSPSAQFVWALPNSEKDQIRFGVSRTYKAPVTTALVPRRFTVNNDNGPTNPDTQGNPNLRPELAWGLDVAYESYFTQGSFAGVSAYVRHIDSVTVPVLFQDGNEWVRTSGNAGSAKVYGLEVELKTRLRAFVADGPDIEARANLARNWSFVSSVPRPNNSLSSQTPVSANIGFDYHVVSGVATGLNYSYRSGVVAKVTPSWTTGNYPNRTLDLYCSWKADAKTDFRLSISNLLHQDQTEFAYYTDLTGDSYRTVISPYKMSVRLTFERKL